MVYKEDFLSKLQYIDGITIIDKNSKILFLVKFNPKINPTAKDADIIDVFDDTIQTINLFLPIRSNNEINGAIEDIEHVVQYFINKYNISPSKSIKMVSKDAFKLLYNYGM